MQRSISTLTAIALGLSLALPAAAQEQAQPEENPAPANTTTSPAADAPSQAAPQEATGEDAEPSAGSTDAPDESAEDTPAEGTGAPSATAPDAAAPETGPAEDPAASGTPAPLPGQPEEQVTVRETFAEWEVQCAQNSDDCALHQIGFDEDENPVVEFNLFRAPEGGEAEALVNILSPLGTFLPSGIAMQVDANEPRQYAFTFCTAVGCIAQIALTEETIAAMRRGRNATLTLASITAPEEPVEVELSLMGFTDAYNSLAAPAAEPAAE